MRMLSDEEVAGRMYELAMTLPEGEETTTKKLLGRIPYSAEELLPVGDLTGVHNLLIAKLKNNRSVRIEFRYAPCCVAMPANLPWVVTKVTD